MSGPNYRQARALALEMETLREILDETRADPRAHPGDIEDLKDELRALEREFFMTGVTSEYDL